VREQRKNDEREQQEPEANSVPVTRPGSASDSERDKKENKNAESSKFKGAEIYLMLRPMHCREPRVRNSEQERDDAERPQRLARSVSEL
jgi:hypothetical protein